MSFFSLAFTSHRYLILAIIHSIIPSLLLYKSFTSSARWGAFCRRAPRISIWRFSSWRLPETAPSWVSFVSTATASPLWHERARNRKSMKDEAEMRRRKRETAAEARYRRSRTLFCECRSFAVRCWPTEFWLNPMINRKTHQWWSDFFFVLSEKEAWNLVSKTMQFQLRLPEEKCPRTTTQTASVASARFLESLLWQVFTHNLETCTSNAQWESSIKTHFYLQFQATLARVASPISKCIPQRRSNSSSFPRLFSPSSLPTLPRAVLLCSLIVFPWPDFRNTPDLRCRRPRDLSSVGEAGGRNRLTERK